MSAVLQDQPVAVQGQDPARHPAPALPEQTALLAVIARAASDPAVDLEKMERLLSLQERVMAKNAETDFNAAMRAAQAEMRPVAADADNKQTRSRYATYAALDRALRPVYTRHGFSISFDTGDSPADSILLLAYVSHSGGHTRTYRALMPADGKGAKGGDVMTRTHAVGSGMSYGMRYLLKMIFNVAVGEDDDDGNGAGSGAQTRPGLPVQRWDELTKAFSACQSIDDLQALWRTLPAVEKRAATDLKDEAKARIVEAQQ